MREGIVAVATRDVFVLCCKSINIVESCGRLCSERQAMCCLDVRLRDIGRGGIERVRGGHTLQEALTGIKSAECRFCIPYRHSSGFRVFGGELRTMAILTCSDGTRIKRPHVCEVMPVIHAPQNVQCVECQTVSPLHSQPIRDLGLLCLLYFRGALHEPGSPHMYQPLPPWRVAATLYLQIQLAA
jgi:hypothetical protein